MAQTADEKKNVIAEIMSKSFMILDKDASNNEQVVYVTRDHGDMANDEVGAADIAEARLRRKEVLAVLPDIGSEIDLVDEWTYLILNIS